MKQRVSKLLLSALCFLVVTGCWDRLEVNDIALIMASSIDGIEQDGEQVVELSVLVYVPNGDGKPDLGESGGGSSAAETIVHYARGLSLADAMANLQQKTPRQLFWSHSNVIIFNEERTKYGIVDDLDFLIRYNQLRERSNIFVTTGLAKDVLLAQPQIERNSAEMLRELTKLMDSTEMTLRDIIAAFAEEEGNFFLPIVVQTEADIDNQGKAQLPFLHGAVVLKDGKSTGVLNKKETDGLLWVRDEKKPGTITVYPQEVEGSAAIDISRTKTILSPLIEDNQWKMKINVDITGNLIQNTTNLDVFNVEQLLVLEHAVNRMVSSRIEKALDKMQQIYDLDVFGFSERFRQSHPKAWSKEKDKWPEIFRELTFDLQVKTRISHPGIMNVKTLRGEKGKL